MRTSNVRSTATVAALLILLGSPPAWANGGTALMWLSGIHLLFGNALIGVLEGSLLARWHRISADRAVPVMVAANYLSMIAGLFAATWLFNPLGRRLIEPSPLTRLPWVLPILIALTLLLSILVEWPACIWLLREGKHPVVRSLGACARVHAVSYTLLIPLYFLVSPITLYTELRLVSPAVLSRPDDGLVYFLGHGDGDVYRIRLDGSDRRHVLALGERNWDARLFARQVKGHSRWDLWMIGGDDGRGPERELLRRLAGRVMPVVTKRQPPQTAKEGVDRTMFNFGPAIDLTDVDNKEWVVGTDFWPSQGLQVRHSPTGREFRIALETPFAQWHARSATLLPRNRVLFQLGEQIVLVDLPTRRLALVTVGRGPLVALQSAADRSLRRE